MSCLVTERLSPRPSRSIDFGDGLGTSLYHLHKGKIVSKNLAFLTRSPLPGAFDNNGGKRAGKCIFAGKPILKIILHRKALTQGNSTYGDSG